MPFRQQWGEKVSPANLTLLKKHLCKDRNGFMVSITAAWYNFRVAVQEMQRSTTHQAESGRQEEHGAPRRHLHPPGAQTSTNSLEWWLQLSRPWIHLVFPSQRGQAPQLTRQKGSNVPHDCRRTAESGRVEWGSRYPENPPRRLLVTAERRSGWVGYDRGAEVSWELIQVKAAAAAAAGS